MRNWERYQVFRDGRPMKFFAVHVVSDPDKERLSIFEDPVFLRLANDPECPVFRMMGYAALTGNKIPNDPEFLKARLFTETPPNLEKFVDGGFLEPWGKPKEGGEFVYFVQHPKTHLVKIGYTTNPRIRFQRLDCEVLGLRRGTRADERAYHLRFKRAEVGGEWFKPSPDLLEEAARYSDLADGYRDGAVVQQSPSVVPKKEKENSKEASASLRKRDPVWDALTAELGAAPSTRSERGRWNRAAKELREAGATADDIRSRCAIYRRRWPEVSLTPTALSSNWGSLQPPAKAAPPCPECGVGGGFHTTDCEKERR